MENHKIWENILSEIIERFLGKIWKRVFLILSTILMFFAVIINFILQNLFPILYFLVLMIFIIIWNEILYLLKKNIYWAPAMNKKPQIASALWKILPPTKMKLNVKNHALLNSCAREHGLLFKCGCDICGNLFSQPSKLKEHQLLQYMEVNIRVKFV